MGSSQHIELSWVQVKMDGPQVGQDIAVSTAVRAMGRHGGKCDARWGVKFHPTCRNVRMSFNIDHLFTILCN